VECVSQFWMKFPLVLAASDAGGFSINSSSAISAEVPGESSAGR
jgi:hypothetical protein